MGATRCRAGTVPTGGGQLRRRSAALQLVLVVVLLLALVLPANPAWAVSSDAQQLLSLINQDRAAVGAQPLTFRDDLVQIAADHSAWMASTGNFRHRSDLSEGVTGPWRRIGENIAYGWSVPSIHRMFMESKGHCENNLYAGFNRVGIEFATGGNGALYVTVVFVQETGGSLPGPTVCPYDYSTTTTTAPATTTTAPSPTTTAPSTTTTAPSTTTTAPSPTTTAPSTTTTVPTTTTTTAPPPTTTVPTTTTTTAPPPTTTAPPATSTSTTAPPVTTTTGGAEVVLAAPTTTTTTTVVAEAPPAPADSVSDPLATSGDSENRPSSPPIVAVAGSVALVAAAGAVWLIAAERVAGQKRAAGGWNAPPAGHRTPGEER